MKIRIKTLFIILSVFMLTACSSEEQPDKNEELAAFRSTVDSFCSTIADADAKINSIDTSSETYTSEILNELGALNTSFSDFAAVDFPEQYDYLEHLADEASDYMSKALSGYTTVYTDNSLSADDLQSEFDDATEYYNNAFKRIKVIMTFLNGETSDDASVQSPDEGTLTSPEPEGQ